MLESWNAQIFKGEESDEYVLRYVQLQRKSAMKFIGTLTRYHVLMYI